MLPREDPPFVTNRDEQAARIDARSLPLIAAGAFLSGVPDQLAGVLCPLGWLCVIIAVVLCLGVSITAWRDAPGHAKMFHAG